MSDLSTQLPQRLTRPEETGLDAGLLIPLLRLLVDGDPVTVEQLAAAASRTLDDVRRGLAAVPDTEYDGSSARASPCAPPRTGSPWPVRSSTPGVRWTR